MVFYKYQEKLLFFKNLHCQQKAPQCWRHFRAHVLFQGRLYIQGSAGMHGHHCWTPIISKAFPSSSCLCGSILQIGPIFWGTAAFNRTCHLAFHWFGQPGSSDRNDEAVAGDIHSVVTNTMVLDCAAYAGAILFVLLVSNTDRNP